MSGFGGGLNVPERIVAPSVPTLEGFPQAVRVGLAVYVSGMVPVDSAGEIVGPGDLAAQTRQATANLLAVVKAARGLPGDLVRVTAYVRNATADRVAMVRRELLKDLDANAPPALTVVGMASLPEPAMEVLVDGVAQLRSEYPDRARMGEGQRRGG
jgi:enamine deaminase RidA (YjgF/YER057c/UK114 family)